MLTLNDVPASTQKKLIEYAHKPLRWIAKRLKLSHNTVKAYRSAMIKGGLIASRRRHVTDEDIARIRRLAAYGYSLVGIAERMDMPRGTIWRITRQCHIELCPSDMWSLTDLERLFQISDKMPNIWRRHGWIVGTPASGDEPARGVTLWLTRRELQHLVRTQDAWPTFNPWHIRDADLRADAVRCRELAGGRWVSLAEVCAAAGVQYGTISKREANGWLDGWRWVRIGRARWLWWPDGAILPPYQGQSHTPKKWRSAA